MIALIDDCFAGCRLMSGDVNVRNAGAGYSLARSRGLDQQLFKETNEKKTETNEFK